jgi:outer membrane lipoprotein LolB
VKPAFVLAAALLAGCASTPAPTGTGPWTSGRMSLRVDASDTQPAQSTSAAFELSGDGERGEIHLNSPLGTRVAAARWAPGMAWLETADGERRFDSLDALSRQALGETLPLVALPSWLAGQPWPQAPHTMHTPPSDGFTQLGWQVGLARRAEGLVEARREAAPAVILRIKLDPPSP